MPVWAIVLVCLAALPVLYSLIYLTWIALAGGLMALTLKLFLPRGEKE